MILCITLRKQKSYLNFIHFNEELEIAEYINDKDFFMTFKKYTAITDACGSKWRQNEKLKNKLFCDYYRENKNRHIYKYKVMDLIFL